MGLSFQIPEVPRSNPIQVETILVSFQLSLLFTLRTMIHFVLRPRARDSGFFTTALSSALAIKLHFNNCLGANVIST